MGSYERWDDWVRGACVWAGLSDPIAGRERIRSEDDGDLMALRAVLVEWFKTFARATKTAAEAVDEAIRRADRGDPALRDALLGLLPNRDTPDARSLGYALRRVRGRICGGLRFEVAGAKHAGSTAWAVKAQSEEMQDMEGMLPTIAGGKRDGVEGPGNMFSVATIASTDVTGGRDA
jgi:hypothetical protein